VGGLRAALASGNAHKLVELRRLLPGWTLEALPLEYPPEDGLTYEDNARIKARFARAHAPAADWVLADDSGVEADALGGRPGIHSARWSGAWVETMLAELDGSDDRGGRYVCVLVAIAPDGAEVVARGELAGSFATAPRGSEGFGYDPIFVPAGESRTVAELGDAWKAEHSHRARAARALAERVHERRGGPLTGPASASRMRRGR
jgi:XTP/dITP diphosphohydrolase